jgi:hypothetical protein
MNYFDEHTMMTAQDPAAACVAALAERLECPIELEEGRAALVFDDGQALEIAFTEGEASIVTPVPAAHAELPEPVRRDLLRRNFPGEGLAGASLCLRPDHDHLQLVNLLPLAGVTAETFADYAVEQANAAGMLAEEVKAAVAALSS